LESVGSAAAIETTAHGYRLDIGSQPATDLGRFESAIRQARDRAATEPEVAQTMLADAVNTWATPYLDLADDHDALPEVTRLERLHQAARDDWFELRLRYPSAELAAELEARTVSNPERDRAWQQLIAALLAIGERRRAESIATTAPIDISMPDADASIQSGAAEGAADSTIAELALLGAAPRMSHFLDLTQRRPDVVLTAIDRAIETGVLERDDDQIRFVDESVRRAHAELLPSVERCRVHDRFARYYGDLIDGAGFEFLTVDERVALTVAYAEHAHGSLPIGDSRRSIDANLQAGESLERSSSWADASLHYRRVMATLDGTASDDAQRLRYQVSIRLGTCLVRSGSTAEGSDILRAAIEVAREVGDDAGFGEAVRRYVEHLPPPASAADPLVEPLLTEAIERTTGHHGETRIQLLVDRATSLHLAAPLAERERLADGALTEADDDDPRAMGLALTGRIGATWGPATARRRLDDARRAQHVAASAGAAAADTMMTALIAEAVTSLEVGDRSQFDRCLEHGLRLGTGLDQAPRVRWWFDSWGTIQLALDGRLDDAVADSEAVVAASAGAAFEALATLLSQQVMFAIFGRIRDGLGDDLATVPVDDSAPELAASLSVVRAIEGDRAEALRLHRQAAATFDPSMENLGTAITLALLAEGAWRLEDAGAVLHLLPTIERLGDYHAVLAIYGGGGFVLGPLAHAAGQLHLLDDSPDAPQWIERALIGCRRVRSPMLAARTEALSAS
ncbi:MAG: bacterial transcriptional activator domain-containing protein, partial [Actinomycetota bacterium]